MRKKKYQYVLLIFMLSCVNRYLIDYKTIETKKVFREYSKYYKEVKTFHANASITMNYKKNGKTESNEIRAEILWNKHDTLLLNLTYSIFNIDVSKIFVSANNYIFTSRTDKGDIFVRGFHDDGYLNQVFNITFPLQKWGRFLFLTQFDLDSNWIESRILEDGRLQTRYKYHEVIYRTDYFLPSEIIYYNLEGKKRISIKMMGEICTENTIFPKKIIYFNHIKKAEILIYYKSILINKKLDKDMFEVKIPSNLEQVKYE